MEKSINWKKEIRWRVVNRFLKETDTTAAQLINWISLILRNCSESFWPCIDYPYNGRYILYNHDLMGRSKWKQTKSSSWTRIFTPPVFRDWSHQCIWDIIRSDKEEATKLLRAIEEHYKKELL